MDDQEFQRGVWNTTFFLTLLRNYFLILRLCKSRDGVLGPKTGTFSCNLEGL